MFIFFEKILKKHQVCHEMRNLVRRFSVLLHYVVDYFRQQNQIAFKKTLHENFIINKIERNETEDRSATYWHLRIKK